MIKIDGIKQEWEQYGTTERLIIDPLGITLILYRNIAETWHGRMSGLLDEIEIIENDKEHARNWLENELEYRMNRVGVVT